MCLCNIRLLLSAFISCVRGHNFLIATETHLSDNGDHSQTYADLASVLRAIKDGILDGSIPLYLLLNIVRVYASCCNNTHYNLDTMDFWVTFWGLFKVMGICFMRLIRENSSYWGKSFIQYQHQCRINFAVPSDTTLKKEITQHRIEV